MVAMIKKLIFVWLLSTPSLWVKGQETNLAIAKNFLLAKQASYQETAKAVDIENVLNFCNDSIAYDHVLSPNKKFSFSGKGVWRNGALSHLGETRNVKLKITNFIQRQNIVIIEFNLHREIKTGNSWKSSTETTVSVMEFDKEHKIKKIIDYL